MMRIGIGILALVFVVGCASSKNERPPTESNLTPGMAKLTIKKNQTQQAEIMEVFGPPDLVTHRDGLQIWTYDKIRYDIEKTSYGLAVIGGVGGSSGGGGAAYGTKRRETSSSTSTMLIIYFDDKDVVRDYRMQVTRF